MMVMHTSSPGLSTVGAKAFATMLSDSEALRVSTMSCASGAPMNFATRWRAISIASVASTDKRYRPRRALAFISS